MIAVSRTQTSVALKTVVWVRDYGKVVPVSGWDCVLPIDVHVVISSGVRLR